MNLADFIERYSLIHVGTLGKEDWKSPEVFNVSDVIGPSEKVDVFTNKTKDVVLVMQHERKLARVIFEGGPVPAPSEWFHILEDFPTRSVLQGVLPRGWGE